MQSEAGKFLNFNYERNCMLSEVMLKNPEN